MVGARRLARDPYRFKPGGVWRRLRCWLGAVADIAAFVEHHLPAAIALAPPDRIEGGHPLALAVEHRPAAVCERARVADLDRFRAPRERRLRLFVESLPAVDHCFLAAERRVLPVEENRVVRDEAGECLVIAFGHRRGEAVLGIAHLLSELLVRIGLSRSNDAERQDAGAQYGDESH